LSGEVPDKLAQLITTALGLVAALLWNTAIQNLFERVFGKAGAALASQFLYAILIKQLAKRAPLFASNSAIQHVFPFVEDALGRRRGAPYETCTGSGYLGARALPFG
jgi:hypothetical protein